MRRELEQAFDYVESYAERLKPFMSWYVENT
jgi:dynein heavy chain